jgi:putative flippase GtrA
LQALLRLIRRLLSKEQRRFIKFCIVGASGVPVNLLCTWVGYQFIFSTLSHDGRKAAAFLLGILVSIFSNFLLNDIWTWKDRQKAEGNVLGRLLRFYLVCSAASAIQFGTAMALSLWVYLHYLLSQLAGIALATAVNFVLNNAWTYRKRPEESSSSSIPSVSSDEPGGPKRNTPP